VQTFLDALHEDREIHCSAIEWVEQQRWHTERVVLIGDAAHAASPLMGQGGSLAIEDALVLADELAEATSTAEALAAYQQRRQSRVSWVHEQSRAVAESVLQLPPPQRNDVLTKDGVRAFAARYAPLVAPP
jgi:2-polyprenyl-6-methoxyphenol hydroxylase-like FAD-dependent oxidoreductase